jgi:hypothetical protein
MECYKGVKFIEHLVEKVNVPPYYNYSYEGMMYIAKMSLKEGMVIKKLLRLHR